MSELLLSEFPVWSNGPLSYAWEGGGGRTHFDRCIYAPLLQKVDKQKNINHVYKITGIIFKYWLILNIIYD